MYEMYDSTHLLEINDESYDTYLSTVAQLH